jgi:DNA helicase-2/ATP-dependent DNA helicase PcrA
MEYLEGLNEAQKNAVTTTEGPLLVLAGAGSGKTRVITHRIIHLILGGVAPEKILAVTFTNKAAKEMRERVTTLIRAHTTRERATDSGVPLVTTFHALGVRMLREHHEVFGLKKQFTIYDRSDSLSAIRKAMEQTGHDPKQFEPKRILSMISRAKGDAITLSTFLSDARSYPERVAGAVWGPYDALLKEAHALDFDDLLAKTLSMLKSHPSILASYQERFSHVHIDEYQDTNRVQYEIARLIVGDRANLCVVGDVDQCLVSGTKITMADGSELSIEKIKKGDTVLSNYGSGDFRPAHVIRARMLTSKKDAVRIETMSGNILTSTVDHTHFAGYVLGITPQTYMTYLMWKSGVGWRLGTTQVYTQGQVKPLIGFVQRSNHEHADATWVVSTHTSIQEARIEEYVLSLTYQIPTVPFIPRRGLSTHGYVHDAKALERIFSSFDTERSARKLLNDYHLSISFPHHRPQSTRSSRKNINVSLCGDRRGRTPMHRISIVGSDTETKDILIAYGFSVRSSNKESGSWRFETARASFAHIQTLTATLQSLIPHSYVTLSARLGAQTGTMVNKNSLPFLPASSVRAGMALFGGDGTYEIVKEVSFVKNTAPVYDIDIEHTHNFIANGIVTHNSIYSWRGADIKNILQFERHFPSAKIIMLEENYRSTQTIIAASNDIIEKNINRPIKKVFTNNHEGERISLYVAMGGQEEAEHVALTAKGLIKNGVLPSEIAVLFRTNFQSRALEEACINYDVPYQMIGTKFFERKEVKDVLSFLRFALNQSSTSDLVRIINTPARGIGKVTILKVVEGKVSDLPKKTAEKVGAFYALIEEIASYAHEHPVHETITFIMKKTGMEDEYKTSGEEGLERLENIRELVTLGTKYVEYDPDEAIEHLLEDVALGSDQDEMKEKEEFDAVRLMTIHASKGLEFPYIFITGLEEGLFPHERLNNEGVDEEEERRLFYVALTRAKKKVFLSYAHIRTIFGSQRVNTPSSFLRDIRSELLESNNPAESGYERTIYLD